jgi:hypothetical protein
MCVCHRVKGHSSRKVYYVLKILILYKVFLELFGFETFDFGLRELVDNLEHSIGTRDMAAMNRECRTARTTTIDYELSRMYH